MWKIIGGILVALISGLFTYIECNRKNSTKIESSKIVNRVNFKNTLISQYNNLFERCDKLSNELYQTQRDGIKTASDELLFYQFLKKTVTELKINNLKVPPEIQRFLKNVSKKLKEDSQNSL